MIRVLHLIPSGADFQTSRCARHLSKDLSGGFEGEVRTIGRRGEWRDVAAAVMGLRKIVEFDVVHAWGGTALTAAALGTRIPIVHSPEPEVGARGIGWVRAVMGYREFQVVCPTATIRRAMVGRGVPLEKCHLVRPGVEFARVRRRRDRELRAALGFGETDHVVLTPGESTKNARHADAVWACGIGHVLDERNKLLLWGRGPGVEAARRLCGKLKNRDMLRVAEERLGRAVEFEELLPAADLVLNSSSGATATLPLSICMAAGLPIVSTVTYTAGELLEDRHTALLTPKRSPRLLAERMVELREDAELQWKLSDMARTEAFEYFSLTRFLDQYKQVYRQWAKGEKVEVTEPPPGAGLRFHGRG